MEPQPKDLSDGLGSKKRYIFQCAHHKGAFWDRIVDVAHVLLTTSAEYSALNEEWLRLTSCHAGFDTMSIVKNTNSTINLSWWLKLKDTLNNTLFPNIGFLEVLTYWKFQGTSLCFRLPFRSLLATFHADDAYFLCYIKQ